MGSIGSLQTPCGSTAAAGTTRDLKHSFRGLYEENVVAKVLRVAEELLDGNVSD